MGAENTTNIQLIEKWSEEGYDRVYKKRATSSFLSGGDSRIRPVEGNAKAVWVAKVQYGKLHNYNRNNLSGDVSGVLPYGYQKSGAAETWELKIIKMDRAAEYDIEMFDNKEGGEKVVGNAVTEINRTVIVPEVDAYCWSTIFQNAGHVVSYDSKVTADEDLSAKKPEEGGKWLPVLNRAIKWEDDHEVDAEDQIIVCSTNFQNALRDSSDVYKRLEQSDYQKDVSFTIQKYEGREIVVVPPARFKTAYDFDDGFTPKSDARDIDFIMMPKSAAVHVTKYQKTRIVTGELAVAMSHMDGYVILARIYHDVFIFDNARVAIYACVGLFEKSTVGKELNFTIEYNAKGVITKIIQEPGDHLTYLVNGTVTEGFTADDLYNKGLVRVGDKIETGADSKFTVIYDGKKVLGTITCPAEAITSAGKITAKFDL